MVNGPARDIRPPRCLQVVCVGPLYCHVGSLCSDVEVEVQVVDTRSGCGRGWVRREEGRHELCTLGCTAGSAHTARFLTDFKCYRECL